MKVNRLGASALQNSVIVSMQRTEIDLVHRMR